MILWSENHWLCQRLYEGGCDEYLMQKNNLIWFTSQLKPALGHNWPNGTSCVTFFEKHWYPSIFNIRWTLTGLFYLKLNFQLLLFSSLCRKNHFLGHFCTTNLSILPLYMVKGRGLSDLTIFETQTLEHQKWSEKWLFRHTEENSSC